MLRLSFHESCKDQWTRMLVCIASGRHISHVQKRRINNYQLPLDRVNSSLNNKPQFVMCPGASVLAEQSFTATHNSYERPGNGCTVRLSDSRVFDCIVYVSSRCIVGCNLVKWLGSKLAVERLIDLNMPSFNWFVVNIMIDR